METKSPEHFFPLPVPWVTRASEMPHPALHKPEQVAVGMCPGQVKAVEGGIPKFSETVPQSVRAVLQEITEGVIDVG